MAQTRMPTAFYTTGYAPRQTTRPIAARPAPMRQPVARGARRKKRMTLGQVLRVETLTALVVLGVVICALMFAAVAQTATLTGHAKRGNALDTQLAQLLEQKAAYETQIASVDDPGRIQSVATNRLGMIKPSAEQIVYVQAPPVISPDRTLPEVPPQRSGMANLLLGWLD